MPTLFFDLRAHLPHSHAKCFEGGSTRSSSDEQVTQPNHETSGYLRYWWREASWSRPGQLMEWGRPDMCGCLGRLVIWCSGQIINMYPHLIFAKNKNKNPKTCSALIWRKDWVLWRWESGLVVTVLTFPWSQEGSHPTVHRTNPSWKEFSWPTVITWIHIWGLLLPPPKSHLKQVILSNHI